MKLESLRQGLLAGAVLLLAAPAAWTQTSHRTGTGGERDQQTGVGVARVTAVQGDASRQHGGRGDTVSAEAGMPLVSGDVLRTGAGGRAELRLDRSNYLRLAPASEVRVRQLGEQSYQIDIVHGTVAYTMMKYGEADVDLRTPESNVVPRKAGVYRITVPDDKSWLVMARHGETEVLTPDHNVIVKRGKMLESRAYEHGAKAGLTSAPRPDGFDEWVARRDQILEQQRGPVYARGPWGPSAVHVGVGWGWPYWDPFWYGGYYGYGYGYGTRVIVSSGFHGGGHRR
jgi:hypothetical protein